MIQKLNSYQANNLNHMKSHIYLKRKKLWFAIEDSITMDCNTATPNAENSKHIDNI